MEAASALTASSLENPNLVRASAGCEALVLTLGLPVAGATDTGAGAGIGSGRTRGVAISGVDFGGDTAPEFVRVFVWPGVATGGFCCWEGVDDDD